MGETNEKEASSASSADVERLEISPVKTSGEKAREVVALEAADDTFTPEPPMTFRRFMSFVAMAFLWTGSQIPVYLFGGIPPYIYGDLGGADRWIWFVLGNTLALAAVCPFVGSLSDLLGRRYVSLIGASFLILGMIIASTAETMNNFICGMTLSGAGAGINELTALAATSELAPTRKRGTYVAILILTIIPFCPSVLWGQLIADRYGWRYIGLFCGVWAAFGFLATLFFYFPPPRVNSTGLSRREVISRIDFFGGFLSIGGMILFMAGMQWGGYQYEWTEAHTLVPLLLGAALLVAFYFWEVYGAAYPMFPRRLKQPGVARVLVLTLVITFISGSNFFSILMFWPTQAFNVYGHDPIGVGIRGLPVGFAILAGCVFCLWALSAFRGHIRGLMIASSVLMTAGCGALAVAEVDNLGTLWGLLVMAGLGIGGIVVPASIITTIICPADLIATVAALTLAIRVIGGTVGYCVYYNVYVEKFEPIAIKMIGGAMMKIGVVDPKIIGAAVQLTAESLLDELHHLPGIDTPEKHAIIVKAGQMAFAAAYKYVYYVSIAFGAVSIIAACFLGDISQYMDDSIAVVIV